MRESQTLVDNFDEDDIILDGRPRDAEPFKFANEIQTTDHTNPSGIVMEVRKSITAYQENDAFSKSRL